MWPHGNSTNLVLNDVVLTRPQGGFNLEGIKHHCREISQLTRQIDEPWALVEVTDESTGIMLDAISQLIDSYQVFLTQGCSIVICRVSSTWREAISKEMPTQLKDKVFFVANNQKVTEILSRFSDTDISEYLAD